MEQNKVRHAVTKLIGKPLEPGTLVQAEVFEELLGIDRNSQAFSWLISHIRRALYPHGIYLSGEGFTETGAYQIFHPRDNYWVTRMSLERMERDLEGKLVLMMNTPMAGLSALETRRHENMLRELSMKLNAMRRAAEVETILARREKRENGKDLPA
jgi:hypothetical protein